MAKVREKDEELEAMLNSGPQDVDFEQEEVIEQEYSVDFSETGDIKDGLYGFKVQDFSTSTSQAGNAMFVLKCWFKEVGRSLDVYLPLTPAAMWKTAGVLRALGLQPGEDGKICRFKRSDVIGKIGVGQIVNSDYTDQATKMTRKSPKVEQVYPATKETAKLFEEL